MEGDQHGQEEVSQFVEGALLGAIWTRQYTG